MSEKKLGTQQSEQHRANISAAKKGAEFSSAHRANLRKSHWSRGKDAQKIGDRIAAKLAIVNKGNVHHSEETRAKISERTKQGQVAYRERMEEIGYTGHSQSEESKAKIAATRKAMMTEEFRAEIAEAAKKGWETRRANKEAELAKALEIAARIVIAQPTPLQVRCVSFD